MLRRTCLRLLAVVALGAADALLSLAAEDRFILVQSTTSTEQSGRFGYILPLFEAKTGIEVRMVAVGTGQAIKNAQNGDGDVLLVHAKPDEERFVAEGWGVKRFDVMYNDFVAVGPAAPYCMDRPDGAEGPGGVGERPLPRSSDFRRAVQGQRCSPPPHPQAAASGHELGGIRRRLTPAG